MEHVLSHSMDNNPVNCLVVHENFLYSGSQDCTIIKWNIDGQCLHTFMQGYPAQVTCLVVFRGDLYSGSVDGSIIKRWTLDGQPLQILKSHANLAHSLAIWNDTLVGGDEDGIIQWTGDTFNIKLSVFICA